jgi:hypothetical protein
MKPADRRRKRGSGNHRKSRLGGNAIAAAANAHSYGLAIRGANHAMTSRHSSVNSHNQP